MKTAEFQLDLFDKKTPIETVVITPTKEMPFEIFKEFWHLAYFMELMDRLPDGRVLWDEERSDTISETSAEAEYYALQQDWFIMDMELPKVLIDEFMQS